MSKILKGFADARRAGCPLVMISTSDPAKTIKTILAGMNGQADKVPFLQHDIIRGIKGLNEPGRALAERAGWGPLNTVNPIDALSTLEQATQDENLAAMLYQGVLFFHNAHMWMDKPDGIQAVWNLRDIFKGEKIRVMLILLSCGGKVPTELRQDIITLEDPMPTPQEIKAIVRNVAEAGKKGGATFDVDAIAEDDRIADELTGTSAFGAEQVCSMAVRRDRIDMEVLSERKRRLVEQTAGLSIWTGGQSFDDLGGLDNLKGFLTNVLTSGRTPVRAIGFIDEIEKAFAAAGTDTSGTTQDQNSAFLRVMQDYNLPGIILLGPPGTGKSEIAKAAGKVAGAPVVSFDLGAAKGSFVGESERKIRAMLDVFLAVSQCKGMFIATCNGIAALPPELRRRFKLGTFFVDLPSESSRARIWEIWLRKLGLDESQELPPCVDWSGAEIAACCDVAFRTGCSVKEAAQFIVPVAVSAGNRITELRQSADRRYLSADKPGLYLFRQSKEEPSTPSSDRVIELAD